ncbi:TetR family transcriptional regulator [Actinomyces sp. 2119]|uniref:TetR/AcrR family transcriptional regulator n=1 Tax=Actinomyces sp. 2119 TaxID=2321393 RepID=UPI0011C47024|nr:TetR family transcriptional regulator [Actinomyces sp. 2119]
MTRSRSGQTGPNSDQPDGGGTRRRPTGRRPGDSGTREAILDSALSLFADRGFEGASVRAIARGAGVDPALIRHFFGDKAGLFVAAVTSRAPLAEAVGGGLEGSGGGERLVRAYLSMWEDPELGPVLTAVVRSAVASQEAGTRLSAAVVPAASSIAGLRPEELGGLGLAGAQLFGVAVARYLLCAPPVAELSLEEVVARLAPAVQEVLDGPADG